MDTAPTDDYYIALAMLHGCEFESMSTGTGPDSILWYVQLREANVAHAIEQANRRATGSFGFESRAALARAYCKHHKLL